MYTWEEYIASLQTLVETYELAESWEYENMAANALCLIMERHTTMALLRWLEGQKETTR